MKNQLEPSKPILDAHQDYLDKMAIEVMSTLLQQHKPGSDVDSLRLADTSYRIALAMLDVKLSLEQVVEKSKLLIKQRKPILGSNNE